MSSSKWAVTQISHILPLDEASLQQILDYSSTLSKDAVADHLKDLLGDSPKALEFISSFNSRRDVAAGPAELAGTTAQDEAPKSGQKPRKKKPPLNKLPPPRQVEGNTSGAYKKKDEEDYMAGSKSSKATTANTFALNDKPEAAQLPKKTLGPTLKAPPSASGPLISDLPNVRTGSRTASRTSSPAPKTKVNIAGGASMHGASSTIQDLDSAIRALEMQTNPTLNSAPASSRACTCQAARHPLLAAAPNCLNCGKIICVKEGIGPCTFCGHALLSSAEIASMMDSLRQERGQERMNANNASQRRADVATTTRPFTNPTPSSTNAAPSFSSEADKTLDIAKQHRDKLLAYQSQNAQRTHIIDEAADFETPTAGQNMWSSPAERAGQLKRQQKILREQEWNAKPEYEKKKQVLSLDIVGGKVVKKIGHVSNRQEHFDVADEPNEPDLAGTSEQERKATGGTFSNNPLLGSLIRPVWKAKDKGKGVAGEEEDKENEPRKNTWRRVQDDDDDNEAWILDGGIYGGRDDERKLGDEEPANCLS